MRIKLAKKRRQENKTDYRMRIRFLKSGKDRIVVRKSNKYILVQLIGSFEAKDKVKKTMTSRILLTKGWPKELEGSLKSIPAAYLLGKIFGKEISEEVILDIGMSKHHKGSRLYALAKGLVDSGVKVNVGKEVFPSEDRLNGEHLKKEVQEAIKKINKGI
jgi:large subunit ribosomal protein L18